MLTPETIAKHELAGLPVRVADASSADSVGIHGRVVRETMRTLVIATDSGEKVVPKRGTTFEFALVADPTREPTDEAAGDRKAPGSASERGSDTAGLFSRQSGSSGSETDPARSARSEREDVVYVTVDGDRLLSRPAERTENAGVSTWR
ncbi:ribonuclease P protein subunit POP4 [Halalkaliarchaeum desulfuricum]|uniref:Ribonuclease P protein component 1 n=1 Tax=Halalkaliarchaeum desulfuricum TaxID=2055893 RepID=A0A343TGW5_9EURY|nr:ribonuclease P protein component 1 [Halalkaliarchaeum desulfuricum]AUX08337.1 ribonuclease P protein subunit POP4 [Halalkaliarchaeum desulfuricum]